MNFALIRKSLHVYVTPLAVISPSLVWITLDKSVWTWDPALYGKSSIELFFSLVYAPAEWISQMLDALGGHAPAISWFGQFFVPLGYLLGSVDAGLLVFIWLTQVITLILMYKSVEELSGHNELVAIMSCLLIASAPLYVGISHQYFTEPLQILSVAWFILIMCFAPKWNRASILSQLLIATPVAMLAKVSSPLYCVGPGLVALWYVFKPMRPSFVDGEWLRGRVIVALAGGALLNVATIAWYYRHIGQVMRHVSIASLGPIADLYGKKDSFLSAMLFWLGAVQNAFLLPTVLWISGLICAFGVVRYFVKMKPRIEHFIVCGAIALLQILMVLTTFSIGSNRDARFLLPLLPYFAVLSCWAVAQIGNHLLTVFMIVVFLVQWAIIYGQAFGILLPNPHISGYLLPVNMDSRMARLVDSIVSRTCTETRTERYWNVVGDQKPWLNVNTIDYTATKTLAPENLKRCKYGYLGYVVTDLDETWKHVLSLNPLYYITSDPEIYPISADKLDQAINQLNIPVLKKVQTSGLFEPPVVLTESPGILIFRRKE